MQGQLSYGASGAERVKGLAEGPNSGYIDDCNADRPADCPKLSLLGYVTLFFGGGALLVDLEPKRSSLHATRLILLHHHGARRE